MHAVKTEDPSHLAAAYPAVKICGICSVEDALAAVKAGTDLIGLIFVPGTPREVSIDVAMKICTAVNSAAPIVGVFQNQPAEFINDTALALALSYVQLHGHESPNFCKTIQAPVIKAFALDDSFEIEQTTRYDGIARYLLFDRPKLRHDAAWLNRLRHHRAALQTLQTKFFLAGGLDQSSVQKRVREFQPFAVDVASAVEHSPRMKDAELMKAFIESARAYNQKDLSHSPHTTVLGMTEDPGMAPAALT